MSASVRTRPSNPGIELGSAVSWPAILAAVGLGVVVLAAATGLILLSGMRASPGEARVPVSPALVRELAARLPAPPAPRPRPEVLHQPAEVVAAAPETPELLRAPTLVRKPAPAPEPSPAMVATLRAPSPGGPPTPIEEPLPAFKRRQLLSAEGLLADLFRESCEVDIEAEKGTSAKLWKELKKETAHAGKKIPPPPVVALIGRRADLKGLPVRDLADCQVSDKEARVMQELSRKAPRNALRLDRGNQAGPSYGDELQQDLALADGLEKVLSRCPSRETVGVRLMAQVVQAEGQPLRQRLIKVLAETKGKVASTALAQRALFDPSPEIREAAIKALKGRPPAEARLALLDGLRYPWAPVADHAAEALVALGDREALPDLVRFLDQPDPRAPVQGPDRKWTVPELVRVNHLGNCLLCHAPSSAREDPVRGLVPERGKPLSRMYYDRGSGEFARADITYLRQDFSVLQTVPEPGQWPRQQRFDFLVRRRELSADEACSLVKAALPGGAQPATYPQREAVLWALRELTRFDRGGSSAGWYALLMEREVWEGR
jgi:hypothetical protein